MLVVAYLVLFALVMIFAFVIEVRYGRSAVISPATQKDHARLALVYAARAQNYRAKSQQQHRVARELRMPQALNSSKPATQSTIHFDFLSNYYRQRADRMQSLGRHHHQMSLVPGPQHLANATPRPAFTPRSNPAKLALVSRH
jgi:hypothetical protein